MISTAHTIILKDQYRKALSSKASVLLHLRGTRNFVALHFQMNADRSMHDTANKNNQDADDQDGNQIPWFRIFIVLGFIVGFWGVCGPLMVKKTW
ncbi:hypothetical protein DVH24_042094 [Malus domestica]|uniref:Uncharacterized protein n=1 Tax=Malus domestica TaxID=3750 RepID=A0A498IPP7_MALDO|nr:hypothetical protein DVH24_042094 [Malus domestica]